MSTIREFYDNDEDMVIVLSCPEQVRTDASLAVSTLSSFVKDLAHCVQCAFHEGCGCKNFSKLGFELFRTLRDKVRQVITCPGCGNIFDVPFMCV